MRAPSQMANQMVFIVNGDASMRERLHGLIALNGLDAKSFASAAEYFAFPTHDAPTCHVLDVNLPDMSGLDLQAQLAARDAAVVFVTDCADISSSVRALKAGAVDFLTAPVNDAELLGAVHVALHRDRLARVQRDILAELERRLSQLTPRELQVMRLIVSGRLNKQAARELGISEITVQIHRGRVMQKMAARSFANLVRMAEMLGISLDDDLLGTGGAMAQIEHRRPSRLSGRRGHGPDELLLECAACLLDHFRESADLRVVREVDHGNGVALLQTLALACRNHDGPAVLAAVSGAKRVSQTMAAHAGGAGVAPHSLDGCRTRHAVLRQPPYLQPALYRDEYSGNDEDDSPGDYGNHDDTGR